MHTNANNLLATLANETRLKILLCIGEKEKNVTSLCNICEEITQSAVSQHLKILRDAGLVKTKKFGREISYKISNRKYLHLAKKLYNFIKNN